MSSIVKRFKEIYYDSTSSSFLDSSSEDELEDFLVKETMRKKLEKKKGSTLLDNSIHRRLSINRNHQEGHQRLFNDYFTESPVYSENLFRRRFQMRRNLFLRIQSAVETHELYFQQRRNLAKKLGLSSFQKITASLRMLAYGVMSDFVDEYVKIGERTANKSLKMFVKTIISVFSDEYLRSPNSDDIARLLAIGEIQGFPGMLGSIDCMHWKWKNCPSAWKAQGRAFATDYEINGHNYKMGYYLTYGIYPSWATFVKTIPHLLGNKKKYFSQRQESTRKDVERAFGVLQARFAIVQGLARFFYEETLKDIMMACIILHNMIVEDERDLHVGEDILSLFDQVSNNHVDPTSASNNHSPELLDFIQRHHRIRDKDVHSQLQIDLIEHLWQKYSMS